MERVEAALKSSMRKETSMKLTPPAFLDDLLVVGAHIGVSTDDFSVDDLLDLSNDDVFSEDEPAKEEDRHQERERASVASEEAQDDEDSLRRSTNFSAGDDFGCFSAGELSLPADDLGEWLSHLIEDPSEYSAPYLTGAPAEKPKWLNGNLKQPVSPFNDESCLRTPVPAKARSKRARTSGWGWLLGPPSFTDSSSSSTSGSSSSNPGSELLKPVPVKKPKRKPAKAVSGQHQPRRCGHCGVQKTPQWRAGPLGAKTLCNACGVRYKSGRLLPEYRPACSPTFSSELHSNSHRKVIEMRRKKEMLVQVEPGLDSPVQTRSVIPSF